jgi:hypothetical protein
MMNEYIHMNKQSIIVTLLVIFLLVVAILISRSPYLECSGVLRTPTDRAITNVRVSLNVYPFDTLWVDAFGAFKFQTIPVNVGDWAVLKVYKDSQVIWQQKVSLGKHTRIVIK